MAKKAVGVVLVALAGVATAVVASSALMGKRLRGALSETVAQAPWGLPALKVDAPQTQEGVFSSTQTWPMSWGCAAPAQDQQPAAKPLAWRVRHQVLHGPFPGGRQVAAAVVESALFPADGASPKPLLTARTIVGFGGGYRTHIEAPAVDYTDATTGHRLSFQGLNADVSAPSWEPAQPVHYEVRAPKFLLDIREPRSAMQVQLTDLTSIGDSTGASVTWWARGGSSRTTVGAYDVTVQPPAPAGATTRSFHAVFNQVESTTEAAVAGDLLSAKTRMNARGRWQDTPIDKLEMQATLRNVHVPSYANVIQLVLQSSGHCGPHGPEAAQAMLANVQKALTGLLTHDPAYSLDKLVIESGGKRAELSYAASTKGITADDLKAGASPALMNKVALQMEARLPTSWARAAVASVNEAMSPPGAAPSAAAMDWFDMMIEHGIAQSLITRDGDDLRSFVKLDAGKWVVNGRSFEAPDFGPPPPQAARRPRR